MDTTPTQEQCGGIAFIGQMLGPLFTEDPKLGHAQDLYRALAELEADAAAEEWPFAAVTENRKAVESSLVLMQRGLASDQGDLVDEHRRLFVGPGHKAAAPWGSVYLDSEGVIFGWSSIALHDWMRQNGIERRAKDRMPEDHIGLMFELMAWLALERPELLRTYLEEHFCTWAPHYLEELERASECSFFQGLARLARVSLAGISKELDLNVTVLKFYR